jgi:hypothetical protein
MTFQRFIPQLEKLEGRLLLTADLSVSAESALPVEANSPDAAIVLGQDAADFSARIQREQDGEMLVIQLGSDEQLGTVSIVGGQSAVINRNGTARLPLPPEAHVINLTISDEHGQDMALVRLELDGDSRIVRQTVLSAANPSAHLANMVFLDQHLHSVAALDSQPMHSVGQRAHDDNLGLPPARVHAMDMREMPRHVMTMPQQMSAGSAAHRPQTDSPPTDPTPSGAEEADEHARASGSVEGAAAEMATHRAPVPVYEELPAEAVEVLAADWEAGDELPAHGAPAPAIDAAAAPREEVWSAALPADSLSVPMAAVLHAFTKEAGLVDEAQLADDTAKEPLDPERDLRRWSVPMAVAVALASGMGAYVLERRAEVANCRRHHAPSDAPPRG